MDNINIDYIAEIQSEYPLVHKSLVNDELMHIAFTCNNKEEVKRHFQLGVKNRESLIFDSKIFLKVVEKMGLEIKTV